MEQTPLYQEGGQDMLCSNDDMIPSIRSQPIHMDVLVRQGAASSVCRRGAKLVLKTCSMVVWPELGDALRSA